MVLPVLLLVLWLSIQVVVADPAGADSSNITYISGTCKKADASFNLSKYYNQEAMRVTDLYNVNVDGSQWDLGADGAYTAFRVMMCEPAGPNVYTPGPLITLIQEKGFVLHRTCDIAEKLRFPYYSVFFLFDTATTLCLSDADGQAAAEFYKLGGGIFAVSDNCPYILNVNKIFQWMPPPLDKFTVQWNNGITSPFNLRNGNPVGDNQFGHHPTFTGVEVMSSGHTVSVPNYNGKVGLGVFAPMCTAVINSYPSACAGEPAAPYVVSHPTIMYVDPLVQLVNYSNTKNWGRIVVDTAFTRYYNHPGYGSRTTTYRFGANVIVWLLNIEKVMLLNTTDSDNQTQVLGCSNGDAVTLKGPSMLCRVSFSGASAPKCLALVVTPANGTTCVVDIGNSSIGTYWIMVDGKNTSLQFTVTASSLTPRGTVTQVTGKCRKESDTSVAGCMDGSSITIDWTLPYPAELTLGLGSTASVCKSFKVQSTFVTCVFQGLNKLPKGRYQTYINQVSTGIPILIETDIPSLNKVLCSKSHSLTPLQSSELSISGSGTFSVLPSSSGTVLSTATPTHFPTPTSTASTSATFTETNTVQSSGTVTETGEETGTSSLLVTQTESLERTKTVTRKRSYTRTPRHTHSASETVTTTQTSNLTVTELLTASAVDLTLTSTLEQSSTHTWQCVKAEALRGAFSTLQTSISLTEGTILNGTNITVSLPPPTGIDSESLHAKWFTPFSAPAYISALQCPNELGFRGHLGFALGVTISFPYGFMPSGSANESNSLEAVISLPPIPDYVIYASELVQLSVDLSSLTFGLICGVNASAAPQVLDLVLLMVDSEMSPAFASAQMGLASVAIVSAAVVPFAAADSQAFIILSMMPCASSYQRRTFALFRALSVFTLDDSYEGVLWGNAIANVAAIVLHCLIVLAVSLKRGESLADATVSAWFPGAYLQTVWMMTFASNAFASLQVLSGGSAAYGGMSAMAIAGVALAVFVILIPGGLMTYVWRCVEAYYEVFEYHKWRRGETNLRVRLLSTVLLPVGRWEPREVRRRFGTLVTLQSRSEYIWMVLPVLSPLSIALFAMIRGVGEKGCLIVYGVLIAVHLALIALVVLFRPLRSVFEDWLAVVAYALTCLFVLCAAVNVARPSSRATERVLAVVVVLQLTLTVIRVLYHIAHIFLARRLRETVPHKVLFEWNFGQALREDDGEGYGDNDTCAHRELAELLREDVDSVVPVDDVDEMLDGLPVPHLRESDVAKPLTDELTESEEYIQHFLLGNDGNHRMLL